MRKSKPAALSLRRMGSLITQKGSMLSPGAKCFRVAACSKLFTAPHGSGLRQCQQQQGLGIWVAPRAVRLPQVERRALGHKQDGAELQLALHCKVLPGERVLRGPAHSPAGLYASILQNPYSTPYPRWAGSPEASMQHSSGQAKPLRSLHDITPGNACVLTHKHAD